MRGYEIALSGELGLPMIANRSATPAGMLLAQCGCKKEGVGGRGAMWSGDVCNAKGGDEGGEGWPGKPRELRECPESARESPGNATGEPRDMRWRTIGKLGRPWGEPRMSSERATGEPRDSPGAAREGTGSAPGGSVIASEDAWSAVGAPGESLKLQRLR